MLTIVLNFLLIPVLGYLGSAWATLACYFMMAALCWWLGERHFPVPYPVGRLLLWLLGAVALVVAGPGGRFAALARKPATRWAWPYPCFLRLAAYGVEATARPALVPG